jgi:hypothetical protein
VLDRMYHGPKTVPLHVSQASCEYLAIIANRTNFRVVPIEQQQQKIACSRLKSASMVIIEIARDFDGFERLLGEHRWSELLVNPNEEEKHRVSKIYYCTYSSGREVQKNGKHAVLPPSTLWLTWGISFSQIRLCIRMETNLSGR